MAICKVLLMEVSPGMELGNDIFDNNGKLAIPYGTVLTPALIEKLEDMRVVVVKIVVKDSKEDFLSRGGKDAQNEQPGYFEKLRDSSEFRELEETFNASVNILKQQLNDVVKKNVVDIREMLVGVKNIIKSNHTGSSMLDVLNCMRDYDDLTYVHSMNVSLICNMMAGWLHYSEEDTDLLTAAGILHDIGKVEIPKEIICKPGRLTDEEYKIVKSHPQLGYRILKDINIDERIKRASLQHHERYDGNGYPNRLRGEQMDDFSRILAIADVYDAMTANRVYREGLCPFEVIEHFQKDISVYDPRYLLIFLQKTAETYVRNKVLLSDGREGEILMINKTELGSPVVMCSGEVVDLSKKRDIKIVKLL